MPQRGDSAGLVKMANLNAAEELERITTKEERHNTILSLLGKMLNISSLHRIESFDISNISGTDIVASMVVFTDGKPSRSDYKRFSVRDMEGQDDYASMEQVVARRLVHFVNGDAGFEMRPDLLLIDGGITHARTALGVLQALQLDIPVFGMVKDDRHRTRALVTPEGEEIRIDAQQAVFAFIGTIQEETHRFAITYHRQKRSKRLHKSVLDDIPGIGPKRKQDLLKHFKTISAIKNASVAELQHILPTDTANGVYQYFHETKE
jgi:excinuclease ABC subunit C